MVGEDILIRKEPVNNISKELTEEFNNINGYIKKIDDSLEKVELTWKGKDAEEYIKKMQDNYKKPLEDFNDSLKSYIDYLEKVFGEYESMDNSFVERKLEI